MADRDPVSSLPPEVLHKLLCKLDQNTLTRVLPLVSRILRTAALAALQDVVVELSSRKKASQFSRWSEVHGHKHLCSLEVLSLSSVQVQLPFAAKAAHLSSLVIAGGRYIHHPSFDIALRNQLTSLEMAAITADEHLLQQISVLQNLHTLHLHNIDFGPVIAASTRESITSGAQQIWSSCRQLTAVSCAHCDLDDAAVAHLVQCLTVLQHLDLSCNQLKAAKVLAPLPASLTLLNLSRNHQHFDVGELLQATAAAAVHQGSSSKHSDRQQILPQLQHLEISGLCMRQPQLLSSLQTLTHLAADELQVQHLSINVLSLVPVPPFVVALQGHACEM